jgi:2-desacetyl-2-hydroxyethyl bacteriochlorophyllide A dehydrogenase
MGPTGLADTMKNRRLYFTAPHQCAVREESLPAVASDQLLVQARCSSISAGTEMLVFKGRIPAGMRVDETLSSYAGRRFEYPLAYGYSSVGEVAAVGAQVNPDWIGARVFAFRPHQSHYLARATELIRLPPEVADEDGVFLAAMETAVNLVMDGHPLIGEKVMLLGQGVIGLLTTALLARFPLGALVALERWPARRRIARDLGAGTVWAGDEPNFSREAAATLGQPGADGRADLVFELSGQPSMLDTAIAWAGFGARIVVGSWYGTKTAPVDLGGRFHRQRIRLISSQVSTIDPSHRARWSKRRRLDTAMAMLARVRPSRLITHRFEIETAQQAFEQVANRPQETLQVLLTYGVVPDSPGSKRRQD